MSLREPFYPQMLIRHSVAVRMSRSPMHTKLSMVVPQMQPSPPVSSVEIGRL